MSFLDRFFGPTYAKELRQAAPLVADIGSRESALTGLSDAELTRASEALRTEVQEGKSLGQQNDDQFRLNLARELGHDRIDVVAAYIGARP